MADSREIAQIVATLKASWPNYQPTAETPAVFMAILGDLPGELAKMATLQCAAENRPFAPSAGEIRDAAIKIKARSAGYPSALEAYRETCDMPASMETRRLTGEIDPLLGNIIEIRRIAFSHPFVEKVARLMGWPREFPTDAPGVDRAQFIKAYESELQRELSAERDLPQVRAYITGNASKQIAENKIKQLTKGMEK